MERLSDYRYSELIGAAFRKIPKPISERLRYTHFFTGVSPIYAGIFEDAEVGDGRSYHNTWCVCYPKHQTYLPKSLRQTMVSMPNLLPEYPEKAKPMMLVHELGHVLDELLDFRFIFEAITNYALTNRKEAFAEAFTLWVAPEYADFYNLINPLPDEARYVFEREALCHTQ